MPGRVPRPKLGLLLPTSASNRLNWADIKLLAETAVDVGFCSLWVSDHLLLPDSDAELRARAGAEAVAFADDRRRGYFESFTILTALAATIPKVEIGVLVACIGYRNPALLAKMADTLDAVSGGRFILGLGAGDSEAEHRAFGYSFEARISRFAEAVHIVSRLLKYGHIDHIGGHYQIRNCELKPRGPRPQGPPLLIGTLNPRPRMRRLVAQYADLWNCWLGYTDSTAAAAAHQIAEIRAACQEHGRDPSSLVITTGIRVVMPGAEFVRGPNDRPLEGDVDTLSEAILAHGAAGSAHVQVSLLPCTPRTIRSFGDVVRAVSNGDGSL